MESCFQVAVVTHLNGGLISLVALESSDGGNVVKLTSNMGQTLAARRVKCTDTQEFLITDTLGTDSISVKVCTSEDLYSLLTKQIIS